ncbi:transcriptional regulator NrdR [Corynebacterium uropygiale]|uniref:Transcriptional repressor NrdR n=1 Tax=Corynebacterium uropygiale TaxID=1775911 RepID=A0A9X1QSZ2_9CORY|nr:transcriptional regulator NrdR [Corynebacterium uropygiale]MCF4006480.1 transcriptional regulator NrdR [Corynebacterium uropygiale]
MLCPFCQNSQSRVIDSRVVDGGTTIRRRRECSRCGGRFTTVEKAVLLVVKRNGVTEPFSRDKLITGVRRACQGRDVSDDSLKRLAAEVEEAVRRKGSSQVPTNEIGLAILEPLRRLDEVAYLRFASVYKSFESAEDFESEIRLMRRRFRHEE